MDIPKTNSFFFNYVFLLVALNCIAGAIAFHDAFYGVLLIIMLCLFANILFLVRGIIKLVRLKKQFPAENIRRYWLVAIAAPVLVTALFLWMTTFIPFHGC